MIIAARYQKLVAAMPANSCMPVSNEPPLFAVSVRKGSKTNRVLSKSKNFSINWINFSDKKLVSLLSESNKAPDKLKALEIPYAEVFDAPVLAQSQAYAICEKNSVRKVGDHDLIVGRLLGAMASLDFDENWKFKTYHPILYLGSTFPDPITTIPNRRITRGS